MESDVQYYFPENISEAAALKHKFSDKASFVAVGTDLMVNVKQGNTNALHLIDLGKIETLKSFSKDEHGAWCIGSMVTLATVECNAFFRADFPALVEAISTIASPVIRQSATLGGNLLCENRCSFFNRDEEWRSTLGNCLKTSGPVCIATGGTKGCFSKFSSDTAPVLMCAGSSVKIVTENNSFFLPVEKLYSGDGVKPHVLPENGIIESILIPALSTKRIFFRKLRPRDSVDFSSLSVAVSVDENGRLKIVMGSVDPGPVIYEGNITDSHGEILKVLSKKSRAVENDFFSRKYRKEMITSYLESVLAIAKTA